VGTRKAPAFQFYPKDFIGDEDQAAMTCEQAGAYIRLICHEWNEGSIPDDADRCARLCGADPRRFRVDGWPAIRACFVAHPTEPGRLVHPRLEKERAKQASYRTGKVRAGLASAAQRKVNGHTTDVNSVLNRLATESQQSSNTGPTLLSSSSDFSQPSESLEAVAEFLDGYRERYQRVTGGVLPIVNSPKDVMLATQLLKTWPLPRLLDMAELFFHRSDPQVSGKPKTLPFFVPMAPWCDQRMAEAGR
jgi:uncharacterized protein YdaU (DUF1376 family)